SAACDLDSPGDHVRPAGGEELRRLDQRLGDLLVMNARGLEVGVDLRERGRPGSRRADLDELPTAALEVVQARVENLQRRRVLAGDEQADVRAVEAVQDLQILVQRTEQDLD